MDNNWEKIKKLENELFSIFVDNIRTEMDKGWLKQLFGYERQITDMYISRKQRHTNSNLFTFVRFAKEKVARRAVQNMDGMEIRGFKLAVSLAKYSRNLGSRKKEVEKIEG